MNKICNLGLPCENTPRNLSVTTWSPISQILAISLSQANQTQAKRLAIESFLKTKEIKISTEIRSKLGRYAHSTAKVKRQANLSFITPDDTFSGDFLSCINGAN